LVSLLFLPQGSDAQTDAQLDAFVREKGDSAYHPSCTCKMGDLSDPMAVVGPDTKVIGKFFVTERENVNKIRKKLVHFLN